ncbi:TIGR02452 family protein [Paenibacillus sp. J2TS4]|uniref:TIGR02452 family protein n=1 Tax=Paenibacillus sp. J2TS4 TaxID=2807194 RepID=UPI001B21D997|nr:TIGR02452 family protein [Paenibacillus sp. J2TS4]GIP36094.1 hypothetical protein J2TS4_53040 [Paenibacillus sp. J2TS4]
MKNRMRLALSIFAHKKDKYLILGAYGCGVFRNDPKKVAGWWHDLLNDEGFGSLFSEIRFAVLDISKAENAYVHLRTYFMVWSSAMPG